MRAPRWFAPLLIGLAWPAVSPPAPAARQSTRPIVLDHVRLIDGTGQVPRDDVRLTIDGNRITAVEPATGRTSADADVVDLTGHVVMPGLIDLHFHIERDAKLAIRQLVNGVTSFRDPGQWNERFQGLKQIIAEEHLGGPRMALAGPHIDGEHPAYPADSVVARDADEARRAAERNVAEGASAIKIYFRLPLASAIAVIGVCHAHGIPCTAHLEILDARDALESGLDAIEHITSFGTAIAPREAAEHYRQQVLADNAARRDGRYALFADAPLDGPEAQRLFGILERTRPFVNPTLAVFEVRAGVAREGSHHDPSIDVRGFDAMKRLTLAAFQHGARLTMGGHSTVPFGDRGEAPWRELELLVESGLTPLQALSAATSVGAASLRRDDLGTIAPGKLADVIVLDGDPSADIHAIRTVSRVMVDGRWVDRSRFQRW
jgi:imidazolonepropionase-like amidohydrolase